MKITNVETSQTTRERLIEVWQCQGPLGGNEYYARVARVGYDESIPISRSQFHRLQGQGSAPTPQGV